MKIAVDTNILVRAVTGDDEQQSKIAKAALLAAELVVLPIPALCELVWVLVRAYGIAPSEIGEAIRHLIDSANVAVNRPAVEAGLAHLDAGGDFADGVIAYEGRWLGAETFLSFDRQAVKFMTARGEAAQLLA
ncbi:MAG TPA: type II toxin-antitoxin system VapC family toxin [Pirellulales bacterium]|jgi:predicted nucleic-acid-binding protein|nr:type II toxin-antitoxin system VapC family toxin [Pirellulales bacterium]